jgi:hypothetical protein
LTLEATGLRAEDGAGLFFRAATRRSARAGDGRVPARLSQSTSAPDITHSRRLAVSQRRLLFPLVLAFTGGVLFGPGSAAAGLISLTLVGGATATDGSTLVADPLAQESLSGTTLTQLGSPLLFDPSGALGLTVRVQNVSDQEIAFPDVLPGVSVLTGVNGVTGYTSKLNVAAGGAAGKTGAAGSEGAISRTVIDLTDSVYAFSSPAVGSNGGGGGAATGVADNWIALTGASGADLAAYLANVHLAPGAWIDVPDFVRITAFQRLLDGARLGFGFDIPTFSFGGITVTCGAWTGTFSEAGEVAPPPPDPVSLPEPGTGPLWLAGLGAFALCGRRFVAGD